MSDESKWHGHGIFDQDCLKCQIKELGAENKRLEKEVERLRGALEWIARACPETSDFRGGYPTGIAAIRAHALRALEKK